MTTLVNTSLSPCMSRKVLLIKIRALRHFPSTLVAVANEGALTEAEEEERGSANVSKEVRQKVKKEDERRRQQREKAENVLLFAVPQFAVFVLVCCWLALVLACSPSSCCSSSSSSFSSL